MNRSEHLLRISESNNFTTTIHGLSLTVSDESGQVVDQKIISMVDSTTVEDAIKDLSQAVNFLIQHKDKQIDLKEPII